MGPHGRGASHGGKSRTPPSPRAPESGPPLAQGVASCRVRRVFENAPRLGMVVVRFRRLDAPYGFLPETPATPPPNRWHFLLAFRSPLSLQYSDRYIPRQRSL